MVKQTRFIISDKDGIDVSDDCNFTDKKGNPFGWSQLTIRHHDKIIGFVESGNPFITDKDYILEIKIEDVEDIE